MSHKYKTARVCPCGYSTMDRSCFSRHKGLCGQQKDESTFELRDRVESLEKQLNVKDSQIQAQETQIQSLTRLNEQLVKQLRDGGGGKRPRVVNNYNSVVNVQLVAFGKDMKVDHISSERTQSVLKEPETSVPTWLQLAMQAPVNRNCRVRNVREPVMQVYTEGHDGSCMWQSRPKQVVLSELVESVALSLEAHAGDDRIGQRFSAWRERLLDDCDADGPLFKQQKALAFEAIASVGRAAESE